MITIKGPDKVKKLCVHQYKDLSKRRSNVNHIQKATDDFYSALASEMYDIPVESVRPDQRLIAKRAYFLLLWSNPND